MTRNTFVFGIGGTGSRVVRALTMLLASGVKLNDTNKIIPIIIDVDADNADTARALKALESYKTIREKGFITQKNSDGRNLTEGFFNTDLNTLSSIRADNESSEKIDDSFQLQFENLETSFIKYLDPKEELADDINMDFLRALYDDTPTGHKDFYKTELNLRLNLGFKGNPNIGCVVFNNLANTKEYKFALKSIGENDRIFIISSIFGGTGSSGFPQLVRLLKEEERLRSVPIGALTIMPYYKVTDKKKGNRDSAINSDGFNSKTEAALTYYAKYLKGKINSFYHLWDTPLKQYDNSEGGVDQMNPAHLVELLGATAVIDFVNKPTKSTTQYFDFGVRKEDAVIDISHFYDETRENIMRHLTLFTYSMKLFREYVPAFKDQAFYKELDLGDKLGSDVFYQNLFSFYDHFRSWLNEMTSNERKFQPFNIDKDLNSLVQGKQILVKKVLGVTTNPGISDSLLKEKFGKIEDELKKAMPNSVKEARFLKLMNDVSKECFKVLETLPSMTA